MAKTKKTFGEYKCKICSKVFSERGGLTHHLQLHTSDKPFSCTKCTFTCKTKKYLHRHFNRVHAKREKANECEICGKKFLYKNLLDKHMYVHTNEKPFKCEVCHKGFNSRYSLSAHRHIHTGAKPYKCSYCDYACRDNSTLRKHQERHTGITRLYQCTACDKSYKTKRILKVHVAEVHMEIDLKTKPCPECGKMFKSLKTLNSHVRMSHLKLYSCKCEICGMTLSSKYNMRAHLTSHIDYRPFKCSFEGCDKRYKDKCALKKHSIIHYPDKHFECDVCKKKFSRLYRMYEHKKQHKAKKKCVFCDYCGKGFYNKNYIISHITRKHMYRQHYICDLCDFLTYNKPSIVMHIKYGHVSEMDRQCKICKKTYKKHIYLKLHYWNTHSIKYKLNKHNISRLRKPKKKINNIIIEEEIESDLKEIELINEIKVEAVSDNEEMKDGMEYSSSVLCEDINRAMSENSVITADKKFKDFFIEQIIVPTTSNGEVSEAQQKETDIYVDVTCQKEAERVRTEMLERWRQNGGVRPFIRLKRHYDETEKNNRILNRVKNEKIEITVFSENESNVPVSEEVSRNIEVNKRNTKKSRKTNDCDKINDILEKFNKLYNEIVGEDENISRINTKITKLSEKIHNNLEKDSSHRRKQIIKKLNRALTKYNNLVNKVCDIQNKESLSSPKNNDLTNSDVIEKGDIGLTSIGDEHRLNSACNAEMTSSQDDMVERDEQALIVDENRQNSEKTSLENDINRCDEITRSENQSFIDKVIKNDEYKKLCTEVTSSENISGNVIEKQDDLTSIVDEYRQSNKHNVEITLLENYKNRKSDMIEKGVDYLTAFGDEHRQNSEYDGEISSLLNGQYISADMTQTSNDQISVEGCDYTELNNEKTLLENDECRDENRLNSDYCNNLRDVVEQVDNQALIDEIIENDNLEINNIEDELNDEIASENDESRCDNHALIEDESINREDSKELKCEISSVNSESGELVKTDDDQASLDDAISQIDASTENYENNTNDSLDLEQVNIENNIQEVNKLNLSENGSVYENSLAELVKLRKRKCVKSITSISYKDDIDNEEFVYINNLKEIDSIIKEIDNMVWSIENDGNSAEIHAKNNSKKLELVKRNKKPEKKRRKRKIKKKVNIKSETNKTRKVKEEKVVRNDELNKTNDEIGSTELASSENDETMKNNLSDLPESNEITVENHIEERDVSRYWTRRSVRNLNKKISNDLDSHKDFDSDDDRDRDFEPDDDDDDDDESGDEMKNKSNKFKINTHQCYVCFKLYETKEKLLDHCKEHFDVCNPKMLKKCPFCEFVTNSDLVRHVRLKHKVNLNYLYGTLKDRKNNNAKSRFYFNVENDLVKEIEVIPSITNLNRQEFLKMDRKRREKNDKELKKTKLVKKDGEWIVEKVLINTKKENYVLPDKVEELLKNKEKETKNGETDNNNDKQTENEEVPGNDEGVCNNVEEQAANDENGDSNGGKELNNDDYCAKMQKLYRIAKKNGQKMLFPCNKCQKICQTLSALKLHLRRHDPNAKPFKKKVWKHKLSEDELKKLQENKEKSKNITKNNKNRYEKPKPIVNKHKCDPKLKDFYEKNIKGGDIEFWQFLKIFNKMTRENVNDFSDLENRTEFGNHFVDPELNPPNENSSSINKDLNSRNTGSNSKTSFKTKKSNIKTLMNKKGVVNKITKENKFKRTVLISKKEFFKRKAVKDRLRKKLLGNAI